MPSYMSKIFEILLLLPMPWQMVLIIFLFLLFSPWLVLRFFPWLTVQCFKVFLPISEIIIQLFCFFEYKISQSIRNTKNNLPGGIYAFSDFLAAIIRFLQLAKIKVERLHAKLNKMTWILRPKWLYSIPLLILPIWLIRPYLGVSFFSTAIDSSVSWWCALEHWTMAREWKSSNLSCRYPISSPKWDTHFKIKEYDYKRQIQRYTRKITSDSNDFKSYYERGNSFLGVEEFDAAFKDYTKSITLNPRFAPGYIGRGIIFNKVGNRDLALKQFSTALKVSPNNPAAYVARGDVYLKMLNFSAAIDDYSNSIRIDPKFAPGYVGRGNVHQMVGNKEAALGAYMKSIQISPNYAVAYAQLGNLYYRSLNNREAAIKEYEKAVKLFLGNGEVQPYNESIRILKSLLQHKIHVVKSGESLSKIAKNYDVLMQDIISSNRVTFPSLVTNPDNIDTGWKLKIPQ